MSKNVFRLFESLRLPLPTYVIQAGAHEGQELDLFASYEVSTCILYEPIPHIFRKLLTNASKYHFYCENYALDQSTGSSYLYLSSNDGMSSSLLEPGKHKYDYPNVVFGAKLPIQTIKSKEALSRYPPSSYDIRMLYMDTQGSELRIIKGFEDLISEFDYIFTEVGVGGGYKQSPSVNNVISYLDKFNFLIQDLSFNSEGWGDALFCSSSLILKRY